MFIVVVKRLFAQRWLVLATALGLVISVALTVSIPMYADAVYHRVLRQELSKGSFGRTTRPPFAFMFLHTAGWEDPSQWEDVQPVDDYLSELAGSALGLPQRSVVRYFETSKFAVFSREEVYASNRAALTWLAFGFTSDLEDHITVLEGHLPAVADPAPDSTVEVLVSESLALELGLQVGEAFSVLARPRAPERAERAIEIPVRIAGVWKATDPEEEYWFYDPGALDDAMMVPEGTFRDRISPCLEDEVYLALWYLVMDGSDVHPHNTLSMLARINGVRQRAAALLPTVELAISPAEALQRYHSAAGMLTISLYAFSAPILGLILAFVSLVAWLAVERQRNEIAVLRSRGATAIQVIGIAALEGLLLGAVALAAGLPVGETIAHVIGKARSFLDFTLRSELRAAATMVTVRFGVFATGVALAARVAPTVGAARHTIVTYRQERARTLRRPWWQRAWLDVLLFIPAAYGTYLLAQQGSITLLLVEGSEAGDPFQNPLLFLVPALGVFALTLFILRLLPAVMAAIAWVVSRVGGVGVLLASRYLSRTIGFYAAPLVLLILTVSLSTFTASLAQTLDHYLYDQTYYQIGADVNLAALTPGTAPSALFTGEVTTEEGPRWTFRPVFEYLDVPGVRAASRIGRYQAASRLSGDVQEATFLGVDRYYFSEVGFWRQDFAPFSLLALMNSLAVHPDGVLVPRSFLAQHALDVGDVFRVTVSAYSQRTELDLTIVGWFDLFPTWYPEGEEGTLFVGNLDYFFEQAGGQFPYRVWLTVDPSVSYDQIAESILENKLGVSDRDPSQLRIYEEQRRPERQGLFGLLSVGFVAAALLTVLGLLLYVFFSFYRRFVELGVLRAIGLSASQMTAFLAWELAFLILIGLGAGTALGILASRLYIPYLQVGAGPSAQVPPFVVEIAWSAVFRIYVLFGLLFVAALGGLAGLLLRMKLFQAIKLGETI